MPLNIIPRKYEFIQFQNKYFYKKGAIRSLELLLLSYYKLFFQLFSYILLFLQNNYDAAIRFFTLAVSCNIAVILKR